MNLTEMVIQTSRLLRKAADRIAAVAGVVFIASSLLESWGKGEIK